MDVRTDTGSVAEFRKGEGCVGISWREESPFLHIVKAEADFAGSDAERATAWLNQWTAVLDTVPSNWSEHMRHVRAIWTFPIVIPKPKGKSEVVAIISADSTIASAFENPECGTSGDGKPLGIAGSALRTLDLRSIIAESMLTVAAAEIGHDGLVHIRSRRNE